jgi:hypothetical protein
MVTFRTDGALQKIKMVEPYPSTSPTFFLKHISNSGAPSEMAGKQGDDVLNSRN